MTRPDWSDYFLGVALAVAARGDCRRSQVGAVLVDDRTKRILSTGYNGRPRGEPGCLSGACPRGLKTFDEQPPGGDYSDCIGIHAETNVLDWWFNNLSHSGPVTMYITRAPCDGCQDYMKAMGVGKVIWPHRYLDLSLPKM